MIRVSKNMKRGTLINDLNEIVQLAEDKCSVVIYFGKGFSMDYEKAYMHLRDKVRDMLTAQKAYFKISKDFWLVNLYK